METYQNMQVGDAIFIHRDANGEIIKKITVTPDGKETVERYK